MSDEAIRGIQRFFGRVKDFFSTREPETPDAPRYNARALPAFYQDRAQLLQFVRETPLVYGFWGDFKRIFKQAENDGDRELLAAFLARFDSAPFPTDRKPIATPLDAANLGSFNRMALQGNYAFLVHSNAWNNAKVSIIDISNPALPAFAHQMPFTNLKDIAVQDNLLFVLTGSEWSNDGLLLIHDISDVQHPVQLGKHLCPRATQIIVQGNLAFLPCRPESNVSLQIVDISDAAQPRQVSSYRSAYPVDLVVEGGFAYMLTAANQYNTRVGKLHILAIDDSTAPQQVFEKTIDSPTGLAVCDGQIIVTTSHEQDSASVFEFPAGHPEQARIVAELNTSASNGVVIAGRYAYVARKKPHGSNKDSGGIAVVDLAEKTVVSILPGGEVQALRMRSGMLFGLVDKGHYSKTLRAFDVSTPAKPCLIGTPPSRETLAYMKRRARRVLHTVAAEEPDTYAAFAADLLAQSGRNRAAVNFDVDWLTVPILFGRGKRWQQTQHDRGRFVCRVPAFVRTRREESYPELWDKTPQAAEPLFTNAALPRETREFALRLLRHHALPIPKLSDAALASSLQSNSALLISQASGQIVASLYSGENVPPALMAEIFFRGTGAARRGVLAFLDRTNDRKGFVVFAGRLYALASANVGDVLTRKQQLSFALLAARFAHLVRSKADASLTVKLYATGRADFIALAEDTFAHLEAKDLLNWLIALNTLDDARRDRAFQLIRGSIGPQLFRIETAQSLIHSPETWVREAGWILLAESATPPAVFQKLWEDLVTNLQYGRDDVTAIATAFASPAALSLLPRIVFDYARLLKVLRSQTQLLEWITPQVFELLTPGLSLDSLLELIGLIPDAQWITLRTACISGLQKFDRGMAFWNKVFDTVGATGDTPLSRRLLDDADLTATFVNLLDIGTLLRSANPAFGPLLGRWVSAHLESFARDSAELLTIATSMQPEIRRVGLARVNVVGMELPFALRLLESELPDAIEAGKAFFEQAETEHEMEYAVALCDSPQRSVRDYGLQYTQARFNTLDKSALFARLSENPDAKVQVWVAQKLRTADAPNADVFDRAVLRQRDTGRKAKEAVKKQKAGEPAPDIDLLLELARSRTPRDAEWALQELAKLALTGAEIPGVTLDGAAGG